ncbi:hypothetical protein ACJO2E_04620 [Marinobacter sp. M1N3S26]|uniref:hypothetical protein n=1 Tax=Marinobacter sp. M1N3S26 TaxID=3382299 RepID=UPI00387B3A83
MDVKKLAFGSATSLTILLLAIFFLNLSKADSTSSPIDLEKIVSERLPQGWQLTYIDDKQSNSVSFYILTARDTLLILEESSCKGLAPASTVSDCLQKSIEQYLPTQEMQKAATVTESQASNTKLNGLRAQFEITDNSRSDFFIEVYKIEVGGNSIFATISIPEGTNGNYIDTITQFLEENIVEESYRPGAGECLQIEKRTTGEMRFQRRPGLTSGQSAHNMR